MNIETLEVAGITFIDLRSLSESKSRLLEKRRFNYLLNTNKGNFIKLTDWKFKAVSTRVGWVMVKYEDRYKYNKFDGTLDEYF